MSTPTRVPETDARAILERVNDVMIVRNRPDDPSPGLWTFPGGPVEAGGSPEVALRKHLRARLGVGIEIMVGQPPFLFEAEGRTVTYRYYICGILTGEPSAKYWPEVRWVSKAQLREYDFEPQAGRVAKWILEAVP